MGKYKVFNGTDWVDICDCNVHIRNANDVWQLVDAKNCLVRYWTGTEWCEIKCCECVDGFILNETTGVCSKVERLPAIASGGVFYPIIEGSRFTSYGNLGAALYPDITGAMFPINGFNSGTAYVLKDNAGLGTTYTRTTSVAGNLIFNSNGTNTQGRLNNCSIWGSGYADDTWFTVRFCVDITEEKTYIFALAGDNQVKANIVSTTFPGASSGLNIVNLWESTSPSGPPPEDNVGRTFNYWHMFPITLPVGNHVFELSGYNFDSQVGFGAEVYDISVAGLQALMASTTATITDLEPYILFTTKDLVQTPPLLLPGPGQTGITYTCPAGATFTDCYGAPQCVVEKAYQCGDVLKCTSGTLTGSGGEGVYKIPLLIPANVCDVQLVFNVYSVPDSLAILDFAETTYYLQTGFFGNPADTPALGTYTYGPSLPQKIFIYDPTSPTNFSVDTTAPNQTIEIIAQEFPITNTNPNKIPLSFDPANPTQAIRTVTWTKGITPTDVIVMIRIAGNPTVGTGWEIQAITCANCS